MAMCESASGSIFNVFFAFFWSSLIVFRMSNSNFHDFSDFFADILHDRNGHSGGQSNGAAEMDISGRGQGKEKPEWTFRVTKWYRRMLEECNGMGIPVDFAAAVNELATLAERASRAR
jgi:hypothetical protein